MAATPMQAHHFRKAVYENGFPPVLVKTASKKPFGKGWQIAARMKPPVCVSDPAPNNEVLSTGILCDGLVVVDVDIDDRDKAEQIEIVARQIFGQTAKRYRQESSRFILVYSASEPPRSYKAVEGSELNNVAQKVEFRGQGQQFVAEGLHEDTKQPYLWDWPLDKNHRNMLPIVVPDQVFAFKKAVAAIIGAEVIDEPDSTFVTPQVEEDADEDLPKPTEPETRMAKSAIDSLCASLAAAPKGNRNIALNAAALQMGELCRSWGISERSVCEALMQAMVDNGYIAEHGEGAALATLRRGFTDGWANPKRERVHDYTLPIDPKKITSKGLSVDFIKHDPPRPLRRKMPAGADFPVEALGGELHWAAFAIADKIQCPIGIAAMSVLGAASLAVQAHADVKLPRIGHCKPLSLFLVSIGATGERKSAADTEALRAIREHEALLRTQSVPQLASYRNMHDAWEAARNKMLKSNADNPFVLAQALDSLGPEPLHPLLPRLTCTEPTFEGLCNLYLSGHPALGLFSDEGGQFVGGHALSNDARLRTITGLSQLWDGSPINRVRAAKEGSYVLPGRRLAMHLMMQPDVAATLLSDPVLKDQGLLSRILVSHPQSTAGTRLQHELNPDSQGQLERYTTRLRTILQQPIPLALNARNELEPRPLALDHAAQIRWCLYADEVELKIVSGGEYEPIKGLANKLPEHAARIAGVLALYSDLNAPHIGIDALQRAINIANFFAKESLRLFDVGMVSPEIKLAETLYEWLLKKWNEPYIGVSVIIQRGPSTIREKSTAMRAVHTLVDHGWLRPLRDLTGVTVLGKPVKEAWAIVRDAD